MFVHDRKGFTLIEILIVIAIIGILALVVFVTLDPIGRFADARNSQRTTNIETIGRAILQYSIDQGQWPTVIPTLNNTVSDTNGFNTSTGAPDCQFASVAAGGNTPGNIAAGCMWADDSSLSALLAPAYLTAVPNDSGTYTHYFVALTPDKGHVVVMSDSMDTNTVSSNPHHTAWYYSTL